MFSSVKSSESLMQCTKSRNVPNHAMYQITQKLMLRTYQKSKLKSKISLNITATVQILKFLLGFVGPFLGKKLRLKFSIKTRRTGSLPFAVGFPCCCPPLFYFVHS
jgi:hypothetical protein